MTTLAPREAGMDETRSDLELVDAANAGDASALEALYVRYREWVVATAHRITRNREEALDVLQDAFLYFIRKFPGFALRAQMKTFLYPVVRNLALERMRRRRRAVPLGDDTPHPVDEGTPGAAVNGQGLARAIERLPEAERETVALRYSDGMGLAQIAAALGVPLGTVKSRLHHALARLGRILKKDPEI
jgi:RNA polymerase sigma-70 factor (ECF subfamily)